MAINVLLDTMYFYYVIKKLQKQKNSDSVFDTLKYICHQLLIIKKRIHIQKCTPEQ